jgi:hypothetical protein
MNGKDRNFFRKMARRENPIRSAMYLPGVNLDEIAWRATREEILIENGKCGAGAIDDRSSWWRSGRDVLEVSSS